MCYVTGEKKRETFPSAELQAETRIGRPLRARRRTEEVFEKTLCLKCLPLVERGLCSKSRKILSRKNLTKISSREKSGRYGKAVSADKRLPWKTET